MTDDGVSCWTSTQTCADDCTKGWDSCKYRWWSDAKCKRWGKKLTSLSLFNDHCKEWGDWERTGGCVTSCSDTPVIGVFAWERSQVTEPWEEKIDGLNYTKCLDGYSRVPGMPCLCSKSFTKRLPRAPSPPLEMPLQDNTGRCCSRWQPKGA